MKKLVIACFIIVGLIVGVYGAQPLPVMPEAFRVLSLQDKKNHVLSLFEKKEALDEAIMYLGWFVVSAQIIPTEASLGCTLFDESLTHFEKHIREFIVEKKIAEAQKTFKAYTQGYDAFTTKVRENRPEYIKFIEWGNGTRENPGFDVRLKALQKEVDNAVEAAVTTLTQNLALRVTQLETKKAELVRENYDLTVQLRAKGLAPERRSPIHTAASPVALGHVGGRSTIVSTALAPDYMESPGPRVTVLASSSGLAVRGTAGRELPVIDPIATPPLGAQATPQIVPPASDLYRAHYQDLVTILQALGGLNEPLRVLMSELGADGGPLPAAHPTGTARVNGKLDVLKTSLTSLRENLARVSASLTQLKGGRRTPAAGVVGVSGAKRMVVTTRQRGGKPVK